MVTEDQWLPGGQAFRGAGKVLYVDLGGGYMGVITHNNSVSYTVRLHFTSCIL